MDYTHIKSFLEGSDALCWKEAVQLHNRRLKNGPSSEKYIHLDTAGRENIDAKALMSMAYESYKKLNGEKGPLAKLLIEILETLRQYAKVIDIFVQCEPQISCLVWGSIRTLLKVTEEEERASRTAAEGILEILRNISRWERAAAISDILSSPAVHKAIVLLYTRVLGFLVSSTRWLKRGSLKRIGIAALSAKGAKFEEKLKQMKLASDYVDKEINTRAIYKGLDTDRNMEFDLQRMKVQVGNIEEYVQQQSRRRSLSQTDMTGQMALPAFNSTSELKAFGIQFINRVFEQNEQNQEMANLHNWLLLGSDPMPPPATRSDGTCEWFKSHSQYLAWIENAKSPNILWFTGSAGCGKSVMAGYLQQYLEAKEHKILFYRFQRTDRAEQSSPTACAASLLFQLLKTLKAATPVDAMTELKKLTTRFPHGPLNCAFETIWAVTDSVLTSYPGFTLIVDALDEGTFKDSLLGSASRFLERAFGAVQKTQSKAVIFSQPDPQFAAAITSCLSIPMSSEVLLPDIMIFAEKEYKRLDLPKEEKNAVLEHIRSSCHGSFWWAALFLDHLESSLRTVDSLVRLDSLPLSISGFYKSALLNSGLDEDKVHYRNTVLAITLQAQRMLKLEEVADALSLRPDKADCIIFSLCKPLINTQAGLLQFSHPSVRKFLESHALSLCTLFLDPHGVLAEKCLTTLLKDEYADLERIKMYLKANYGEEECINTEAWHKSSGFYDYASRFWYRHLILTASPSVELLRQTNTFLLSYQFAYWSQYTQKHFGLVLGVTDALGRLKLWHCQLPSVSRELIDIEKCPTASYNKLSAAYGADKTNMVYQWLARLSLCNYGLTLGLPAEVSDPGEAAAKLLELLGPNHPFVLRAKSSVAYARFQAGRMRAGYRIYTEILEAQRAIVGENHERYFEALHYVGEGEYYMADFAAATATFLKSSVGFLEKVGPESWSYLAAQCWFASSLAYLDQLELSLEILESAFRKRRDQFGGWDGLARKIQVGMADVQRALGRREEAIVNFKEALESRRGSFSTSDTYRLDVEIVLARTYQEAGMNQTATSAIQRLEQCESLRAHFERVCQVAHIKGLLLASDKRMDEGINCFLEILIQAEEDQNNRALLWVRLDLAKLLRQRHKVGDRDLASSIFDKIVKDVSGDLEPGLPDEPDPPRLLAVAEKALTLVRAQRYDEAQGVLDSEKADWLRPSDFWLWVTDAILL